ncbi:myosin heavy chain [Vairimorpha necatrix]|uniref:Myosin heavy chain n=1 Tax=Vairimorpha necatrix TaxID=6039 RepID=A0AAX4JBJ2_9MICR
MKTEKKEEVLNLSEKNKSTDYKNIDKKWIWVTDKEKCYVVGHIIKEENDKIFVEVNNEIITCKESEVSKMNPPKFDLVDDLGSLSYLNEPSVLHNLISRYQNNLIYTYSGLFLLSVNPYRDLKIYNEKFIKKYSMNKKNEVEPHIYGVANEAYNNMLNNKENQSILITGESGAGKTENTKKVIEFLSSIAGYSHILKNESRNNIGLRSNEYKNNISIEATIDKKIIMSNPILEAFGNAKTIKNDNSSRFGKFIQIKFNGGNICGAFIEKYLLEKSRITYQNQDERNYHIFYQILKCNDKDLRKTLFIDEVTENFRFLKGTRNIEGIDDTIEFSKLREAFRNLNISEEVEIFYYKIVAAVLHLGNIKIIERNGKTEIENLEVVDKICKLLEIPSSQFINSLLYPVIKAGKEFIVQSRSTEQVYSIIDALAKILYDKMFDQIINELNNKLGTSQSTNFIGVLDIAGFEIFQENGFEQLCINYTNEKLQQFFNHHMFILEQDIYKKENIEWNFIDFGLDLQPTIDLIEKSNPIGILSYLDEECVMPKASDETFLNKLNSTIKNSKFKSVYFKDGFILEHYAGNVEYLVNNWITKNKDPNFENINELINKSANINVSNLSFVDKNIKRGFFRTVGQKHKEQLNSLMNTLSKTNPHFVRCIIPNLKKLPNLLENKLILEQLKCNGVLEGIRISRQGYPSRMSYNEFNERYKILRNDISVSENNNVENINISPLSYNNKEYSQEILKNINLSEGSYKFGITKIFFRQGILADIENLRDIKISEIMKKIQELARIKLENLKETLNEHRNKAIKIVKKNAKICIDLQKWNWWKVYLKIKPLLDVKMRDNELKEKDKIINKLNENLEEIKKKYEALNSKNIQINQENEKINKELEIEKIHILENSELIQGIRNEAKEIEKEKEDLKNKIKVLLKDHNNEKSELIQNLEKERNTRINLEGKIEDLENNRLQNANEELRNLQKLLNNLKEENKVLLKENNMNTKDLQNKMQELKEITVKNEDLNDNLKISQSNLETSNNNLKKLKEEKNDLIFENENLEKNNLKLEKDLEDQISEFRKIFEENKSLKSDFNLLKSDNNINLKKIKNLEDQILELENSHEKFERVEKSNFHSEKIINKLKEKLEFYINSNNLLRREIDDIREKNDSLTQARMDEFFEGQRKFELEKKNLKKQVQRLTNENFIMKKELDDLKASSESSEDSTLEKLYLILDKEKKLRRDLEQKILEYESQNHNLQSIINDLSKCICSTDESCICKCASCDSSCRSFKNIYVPDTEEIEKIIKNVNLLIEGFNTSYFKILYDQKSRINALSQEMIILKNNLLEKEKENQKLNMNLQRIDKEYNNLQEKYQDINNKMADISSINENYAVNISRLESEVAEKDNIIEIYNNKYEKIKKSQVEISQESEKYLTNLKKATQAYEQRLREYSDSKDKEISNLKSKLGDLETKLSLEYNKYELLCSEYEELKKNNMKIEPINIDYNPNHLIKIQDLERKKIILEKEIKNIKNKEKMFQMHFDKFKNENKELKKNIEDMRNENFNLLKDNNMLSIKSQQMERDISDSKEMIDFLKNISLSIKKKK